MINGRVFFSCLVGQLERVVFENSIIFVSLIDAGPPIWRPRRIVISFAEIGSATNEDSICFIKVFKYDGGGMTEDCALLNDTIKFTNRLLSIHSHVHTKAKPTLVWAAINFVRIRWSSARVHVQMPCNQHFVFVGYEIHSAATCRETACGSCIGALDNLGRSQDLGAFGINERRYASILTIDDKEVTIFLGAILGFRNPDRKF